MPYLQFERNWFESWRGPSEFFRAADRSLEAFFASDKVPPQHLREAYTAGLFACIWFDDRGPCEVRLVPSVAQFPDAQLKASNKTLQLEVTMALEKDRPMFREWRELRAKAEQGEFPSVKSSQERRKIALEAISRVIARKAKKHYAVPPTLLVHSDDGLALSTQEMVALTEPWKDTFNAIYLLCGINAIMVWPTLLVLRATVPPW